MTIVAVLALGLTLAVALAWRSPWAPAAGAVAGVGLAIAGSAASLRDVAEAASDLWRPGIVIVSIMAMSACAAELGVLVRVARWIEPATRGPVRRGFRATFAISALTAALLSNDAAILLVTPIVLDLLRAVYPRRHPKLVVPFAFAVFVAAGVAPLPTGNPMNLVVTARAGIGFNAYALVMVPVALAGWLAAYAALAWAFRGPLADEAPALGAAPPAAPLSRPAQAVLVITLASVATYPVLAAAGHDPWVVAAPAGLAAIAAARLGGVRARRIAAGVSWELVPFVLGVLVLAAALARGGVADALRELYAASPAPLATVGGVATVGSALVNNHSMALVHSHALADAPARLVYAALVGGDLGPRLLPIGSLAGLLWLHALRRADVAVPLRTFIYVGAVVTIPSLLASLATLWLVT
jgi:arsenical pump membrane protein